MNNWFWIWKHFDCNWKIYYCEYGCKDGRKSFSLQTADFSVFELNQGQEFQNRKKKKILNCMKHWGYMPEKLVERCSASNLIQIERRSVEKGCLNNNLEGCRNWEARLHFSTPRSPNRHAVGVCETNSASLRCWGGFGSLGCFVGRAGWREVNERNNQSSSVWIP